MSTEYAYLAGVILLHLPAASPTAQLGSLVAYLSPLVGAATLSTDLASWSAAHQRRTDQVQTELQATTRRDF